MKAVSAIVLMLVVLVATVLGQMGPPMGAAPGASGGATDYAQYAALARMMGSSGGANSMLPLLALSSGRELVVVLVNFILPFKQVFA